MKPERELIVNLLREHIDYMQERYLETAANLASMVAKKQIWNDLNCDVVGIDQNPYRSEIARELKLDAKRRYTLAISALRYTTDKFMDVA